MKSFDHGKLRARREELGMSRRDLALAMHEAVGESPHEMTIYRWEVDRAPGSEHLAVLAEVLDVSIDYFFSPVRRHVVSTS